MTIQTRKDLILETIDNYTSKALIEQNFDFSSCNAHILSLDLHIDRSNISRILNQLFTKGDLIKTSSRPTLYISRKVIEEVSEKLAEGGTLVQEFLPHPVPHDNDGGAEVLDKFGYTWYLST